MVIVCRILGIDRVVRAGRQALKQRRRLPGRAVDGVDRTLNGRHRDAGHTNIAGGRGRRSLTVRLVDGQRRLNRVKLGDAGVHGKGHTNRVRPGIGRSRRHPLVIDIVLDRALGHTCNGRHPIADGASGVGSGLSLQVGSINLLLGRRELGRDHRRFLVVAILCGGQLLIEGVLSARDQIRKLGRLGPDRIVLAIQSARHRIQRDAGRCAGRQSRRRAGLGGLADGIVYLNGRELLITRLHCKGDCRLIRTGIDRGRIAGVSTASRAGSGVTHRHRGDALCGGRELKGIGVPVIDLGESRKGRGADRTLGQIYRCLGPDVPIVIQLRVSAQVKRAIDCL